MFFQLFYGKNGSGPQIKRNIRKFAGFEEDEKQKKLDQLLEADVAALKQTATILALEVKKDETKENIAKSVVDFLMSPTGKTFEEVQKDEPEEEEEPEEEGEPEDEEEDEEEEVKPKARKGRGGANANSGIRPKRATASRVWTNGELIKVKEISFLTQISLFRLWK